MGININVKGKTGEREMVNHLEPIVQKQLKMAGYPETAVKVVQRNQNQSAVGGGDISIFGLALEIKRQETLTVDKWWKQTITSAQRNGETPVLLYRQNRKQWRCVLNGAIALPICSQAIYSAQSARVEVSFETFLTWFEEWVRRRIAQGEIPRV